MFTACAPSAQLLLSTPLASTCTLLCFTLATSRWLHLCSRSASVELQSSRASLCLSSYLLQPDAPHLRGLRNLKAAQLRQRTSTVLDKSWDGNLDADRAARAAHGAATGQSLVPRSAGRAPGPSQWSAASTARSSAVLVPKTLWRERGRSGRGLSESTRVYFCIFLWYTARVLRPGCRFRTCSSSSSCRGLTESTVPLLHENSSTIAFRRPSRRRPRRQAHVRNNTVSSLFWFFLSFSFACLPPQASSPARLASERDASKDASFSEYRKKERAEVLTARLNEKNNQRDCSCKNCNELASHRSSLMDLHGKSAAKACALPFVHPSCLLQ